jgi:hypothetical protein
MALLEAVESSRGMLTDKEVLRSYLVDDRVALERSRLRGVQASFRGLDKLRTSFQELTKDNVSFLRKTGLLETTGGRMRLSARAKHLLRSWRRGNVDGVMKAIIRTILCSSYIAYIRFLLNLQDKNGIFKLPVGGDKRSATSPLRASLNRSGFRTDIASFYTIRDLFSDFGLINTVVDRTKEHEIIFLTSKITRSPSIGRGFRDHLYVKANTIHYGKVVPIRLFCKELVAGYASISDNWGKWVRLIDLRDAVTVKLRITDDYFNDELVTLLRNQSCTGFSVEGSAGYRVGRITYGTLAKAAKMPITEDGTQIQYVSINRR